MAFLTADPAQAAAWAGVVRAEAAGIGDYVASLTPVRLRYDTRVVNHGYRDGRPTPRDSVLQAGTAVLVDEAGRPRVRCGCGNPLRDPERVDQPVRSDSDPWVGFAAANVLVITPAAQPIGAFMSVDVLAGGLFARPRGTSGEADGPPSSTTIPPLPTSNGPPPLGPIEITFPDRAGRSEADARAELRAAGHSGEVRAPTEEISEPNLDGRVLTHIPVGGQRVAPSTPVELIIGVFRAPPIDMPDVLGLTPQDAGRVLAEAGYQGSPTLVDTTVVDPANDNLVIVQSPPPGDRIDPSAPVTLTVGRFEAPPPPPDG